MEEEDQTEMKQNMEQNMDLAFNDLMMFSWESSTVKTTVYTFDKPCINYHATLEIYSPPYNNRSSPTLYIS